MKLRVAAPPVDGKANSEVCRYLKNLPGLPQSRVEVVRGAYGCDKVVLVWDVDPDDLRRTLATGTG